MNTIASITEIIGNNIFKTFGEFSASISLLNIFTPFIQKMIVAANNARKSIAGTIESISLSAIKEYNPKNANIPVITTHNDITNRETLSAKILNFDISDIIAVIYI